MCVRCFHGSFVRNRACAQHVEKPLRLFVWNYDFDVLRQVVLVPNRTWGSGEGLIGCGIGFGLLHRCASTLILPLICERTNPRRIPKPQDRPAVFEENDLPEGDDFEEVAPAPVSSPPKRGGFDDGFDATDGVSVVSVSTNEPPPKLRPTPLGPSTRSAQPTRTGPPVSPRRKEARPLPAAIEEGDEE